MKRFVIFVFVFVSCFFTNQSFVAAQQPATASSNVKVSVPGKNLSLSGIVSPNASVVLLAADGTPYQGTVADATGNFTFKNILVAQGIMQYCLETVDVKRLGNSLACFTVAPGKKPITVNNIFLPPTIGLQRQQIVEGSDAVVYGFSMPSAHVAILMNKEQNFPVTTDATGYYEYKIPNLKVGTYQLVAGATYESKPSAPSLRPALLQAISVAQASSNWLKEHLWIFLVGVGILILAILAFVFRKRILGLLGIKDKRLHHWWFVGY